MSTYCLCFKAPVSPLKLRLTKKPSFCGEEDDLCLNRGAQEILTSMPYLLQAHVLQVLMNLFYSSVWNFSLSSLSLKLTWVLFQVAGIINESKIQSSSPKFQNIEQNSVPQSLHGLLLDSLKGLVLTSLQVLYNLTPMIFTDILSCLLLK